MKRKIITFVGLMSPLLLMLVCMVVLFAGVTGWWFFGRQDQSGIIRIMQLAPLVTPQVAQTQNSTEDIQPGILTEADPELAGGAASESQTDATNSDDTHLTAQEIEEALGFAVPTGAVNSITQQGLGERLVIPKLNLDAAIMLSPIENRRWKVDHLGQAVGHLEGTASPGSNSNLVLAAHVTLSAGVYGPFAGLGQLTTGDVLMVSDGEQVYQYVVEGLQSVDQTAVEVAYPSETGKITLITCSNWDHDQERYVERLVVTGHLVEG